jgi:hypothetical protein
MSGNQNSRGSLRVDGEPGPRALAALSALALVATVSVVAVVQATVSALGWL